MASPYMHKCRKQNVFVIVPIFSDNPIFSSKFSILLLLRIYEVLLRYWSVQNLGNTQFFFAKHFDFDQNNFSFLIFCLRFYLRKNFKLFSIDSNVYVVVYHHFKPHLNRFNSFLLHPFDRSLHSKPNVLLTSNKKKH